mgnify:CR=1 FL=1
MSFFIFQCSNVLRRQRKLEGLCLLTWSFPASLVLVVNRCLTSGRLHEQGTLVALPVFIAESEFEGGGGFTKGLFLFYFNLLSRDLGFRYSHIRKGVSQFAVLELGFTFYNPHVASMRDLLYWINGLFFDNLFTFIAEDPKRQTEFDETSFCFSLTCNVKGVGSRL